MTIKRETKIWMFFFLILFLGLWAVGDVLSPFILGAVIAYLFNPVVERMQKWGISRSFAVTILVFGIVVLVIAFLLAVIPVLVEQCFLLVSTLPNFFEAAGQFVQKKLSIMVNYESIAEEIIAFGKSLSAKANVVFEALFRQAASFVNIIVLVVITPVVAIYLLIDWKNMIEKIDALLPRDHAPEIRQIFTDIDKTLASFLRGQGMVCSLLGLFYIIGLSLVGLNFAVLIGVLAGLLTFIPYLGAIIGAVLALGLGAFQFWGDWGQIALVGGVFVMGQVLEGNFLTPKLVGKSVRLHPVWVLFAISVFGKLFGFVGVLVAVPVAAVIGVLVRYGLKRYQGAKLYQGRASL